MLEDRPASPAGPAFAGNLLDFLAWVAERPRTYGEVMEAWRTSCPRLSAWEDATSNELVRVDLGNAATQAQAAVLLTDKGAALLNDAALG
jgi:hypothetical protein